MGSEDHDRERVRDIVERLRKLWFAQNPKLTWDDMEAITEEAAEEITRLRAENEKLRRDVKTAVMGDSAELQDVKRENETLRKALKPFAHNYQNNGLSYSTFMFAMKDLLAAKKALGDTDE